MEKPLPDINLVGVFIPISGTPILLETDVNFWIKIKSIPENVLNNYNLPC